MLDKLIAPALRTPKLVLALVAIAFVLCGAIGTQAAARLSNGGFVSTHSESAQVGRILERDYGISGMQLVLTVESSGGAEDPATAARGKEIAQRLKGDARVSRAVSPWALAWIAVVSFVLLYLLTGSVVLPLKALVLNVLSLSATFGALVWIFQDGHLGGLGTQVTGYTIATLPVLLFCVAFGLSMDYEVFLLARFTEEWGRSAKTRADNDTAVALGIARSGRIVTAAALLMAVVFAGIAASEVTMNRMLGLGLALAVLMDATLVRMVLVPAFMRAMGTANWWAPPLSRSLLERAALRE